MKMAQVVNLMTYKTEENGFSLEKSLRKDLTDRLMLHKREL